MRLRIWFQLILVVGGGYWTELGARAHSCYPDHYPRAQRLVRAGLIDSASVLLSRVYECLTLRDQLTTPRGLEVRRLLAYAHVQAYEEAAAVELLYPLINDCERLGQSTVEARARLALAAVQEGTRRLEECRRTLDATDRLIRRAGLDSLLAHWAIRKCSYFRVVGEPDSVRFYGEMALRAALQYRQEWELAHAYTLQNEYAPEQPFTIRTRNLRRFLDYNRSVENYGEAAAALIVIGLYYHGNGYARHALAITDTVGHYLTTLRERGQEVLNTQVAYHDLRARAFEDTGQLDSALNNAQLSRVLERQHLKRLNRERVAEIEAQYQDETKARQIQTQQAQLAAEQRQFTLLLFLSLLIATIAVLLMYYNRRLRVVNDRLGTQSGLLESTNLKLNGALEHQMLLRSELHHRVKNNLQILINLLELQGEEMFDPRDREGLEAMKGRIYSMGTIHEVLYDGSGSERVPLQRYLTNLCHHVAQLSPAERWPQFQFDLGDQRFGIETLMPLGIIVNELLTNSMKHGRVPDRPLRIFIRLRPDHEGFYLLYRDNGPGFPREALVEREGGLGTYLLRSMCRQLRGRLESANGEQGATVTIYFNDKRPPEAESGPMATATFTTTTTERIDHR